MQKRTQTKRKRSEGGSPLRGYGDICGDVSRHVPTNITIRRYPLCGGRVPPQRPPRHDAGTLKESGVSNLHTKGKLGLTVLTKTRMILPSGKACSPQKFGNKMQYFLNILKRIRKARIVSKHAHFCAFIFQRSSL